MPTIDYELTLLLQALEDGTTLGEALFFPEAAVLAATRKRVREHVAAAAKRTLEELPLPELARRTRAGTLELARVRVTVAPPRRDPAWQEPVEVELAYAHWAHGTDAAVAVVPALQIQVLAERPADLPDLVVREAQLALSRMGARANLNELAFATRSTALSVEAASVRVYVKSPREAAAADACADAEPQLPQVATDLTAARRRRAHEVEAPLRQLVELIAANPPRSVLLVGRSGVGKSALVGELVRRRAELGFAHTPFWATTGARLVAGMTGFGMWQERCGKVVREAAKSRAVLHVGSMAELIQVGRSELNEQGIASFLKPYLARGELTAIAECTPEQLAVLERADPHLTTVWTTLALEEPKPAAARVILESAAARATRLGRATVDAAGLDMLERLHRRYATYSAWPGRPLRFLEGLVTGRPAGTQLGERAVVDAFSEETGLPRMMLDDACVMDLAAVRAFFEARVLGQPSAVDLVTQMLATVKARLTRPRRPIASLLFIGPTGVGKTETARALAQYLFGDASRLTRFDMSEFSDPASAQRLVGAAGAAEGLLTARVREQPFAVVLLDEFEKADPSLLDLLLQVLGDARLTDAAGRVADFSSAVVILTSNLGADSFARARPGFATGDDAGHRAEAHFVEAVRAAVRPELFNRIDRVVPFLPLSREVIHRVARRELDLALRRDGLVFRRARVTVDDAAVDAIAAAGHDPRYGARPLKRALERMLLVPLAAGLVRHPEGAAVTVDVGVAAGQLDVRVRAADARDATAAAVAPVLAIAQQFRRDVQRLERCSAVTQLTNELYTLTRAAEKAGRRRAPAGAVKLGGRGRRRTENERYDAVRAKRIARLTAVQQRVATLRALAVAGEDAALFATYRALDLPGVPTTPALLPVDVPTTRDAVADALRGTLVALRSVTHASPDAISLLLAGDDLEVQVVLASAYAQVARALSLTSHLLAIQPGKDGYEAAPVADPAGFLRAPPPGVVALVLTLEGPGAGLRFESETGIHRFRKRTGDEVPVEVSFATLPFAVPAGIERRGQVPASGPRRRLYHLALYTCEDSLIPGNHAWSAAQLGVLTERAMDLALMAILDA